MKSLLEPGYFKPPPITMKNTQLYLFYFRMLMPELLLCLEMYREIFLCVCCTPKNENAHLLAFKTRALTQTC